MTCDMESKLTRLPRLTSRSTYHPTTDVSHRTFSEPTAYGLMQSKIAKRLSQTQESGGDRSINVTREDLRFETRCVSVVLVNLDEYERSARGQRGTRHDTTLTSHILHAHITCRTDAQALLPYLTTVMSICATVTFI